MHAGNGALRAFDRAFEIVAFERLLGSLPVPRDRTPGLSTANEVLGERDCLDLGRTLRFHARFEPLAREAVTDRPVALGEHGVRGLAHDRVTERVLGFSTEPTIAAHGDELATYELVEPIIDLGRTAVE